MRLCRRLDNGNLELGVHIADVTNFVKHGTAIDVEAANRGNTTYLVERRLDMLPGLLTTTLCSLVSGVDRFAFSVTWEVTPPPEVRVVGSQFFKSIIHSRAALTYEQAQNRIDDGSDQSNLTCNLRQLNEVAKVLRYVARSLVHSGASTDDRNVNWQLASRAMPLIALTLSYY